MKKVLCIALCAMMCSCGVYKKYQSQTEAPKDLYGTGDSIAQAMNESSIASISWREFFVDPILQQLIDSALARNTDMASARLAVEQAQASLTAAKWAFVPSLSLNPQGNISTTMFGAAGKGTGLGYSYSVPLQLDWNIGISGSLIVNKRKTQAILEQAKASREATQANLISTVAQEYFQLLMLDKQLEILVKTDSLWDVSLETEKALWENGQAYSTAVNQMESSNLSVKTQIIDTRRSILSTENEICKLLHMTPQAIQRNKWGDYTLPERFSTGVPLGSFQFAMKVSKLNAFPTMAAMTMNRIGSALAMTMITFRTTAWLTPRSTSSTSNHRMMEPRIRDLIEEPLSSQGITSLREPNRPTWKVTYARIAESQ